MCYTRHKIEGGVGKLRESDDTTILEPNGQSRKPQYLWFGHLKYRALTLFLEMCVGYSNLLTDSLKHTLTYYN